MMIWILGLMNCDDLDSSFAMELFGSESWLLLSDLLMSQVCYESSLRPMGSRVILVASYASCRIWLLV